MTGLDHVRMSMYGDDDDDSDDDDDNNNDDDDFRLTICAMARVPTCLLTVASTPATGWITTFIPKGGSTSRMVPSTEVSGWVLLL